MNSDQQQEAFEKLSRLKVGALFMDAGTGKTKVALDLISSKQNKVDYVLWICPCALKSEIESERMKWHPELELDVVGCESIGQSDRIYIETLKKVQSSNAFIIVDESLKIKNIWAKRTKRIIEMGRSAKYKLILNGTPLTKNIMDIWSQMEFLSPKILNMSYNEYKDTYCEYYLKGKMMGKIKKHCNIPHLISKIEPYIVDAELELNTSKVYHVWGYSLDSKTDYCMYKQVIFDKYYNRHFDKLNFNAFSMQCQRYYLEHSNRMQVLDKLIKQIDDKVIVFVRYLDSIPDGAVSITGDRTQEERKQIIEDFREGKFQVLYITYGCGSFGLNLQFCSNMIFAENIWDYAQKIQAEARIYRMGQEKEVHYYNLECEDVGLEELFNNCLENKENILYMVNREIQNTKGGVKEFVKKL